MTNPTTDPNREYQEYAVMLISLMILIAGIALGWIISFTWTIAG